MPHEWIPPELFVKYAGVAVYHCYGDDDTVSGFWYTTDPSDCTYKFPETEAQFDVRELPNLGLDAHNPDNHRLIIEQAIQAGLLSGAPAVKFEPAPLRVKIEVLGGVAYVVEKPPGLEVEIIDRDQR